MLRRRRVPLILQMSAADCGAACLAMILGHHGRAVPLDEVREQLGTGRDGATAAGLSRTARACGMRVKAYSAELSDLPLVPLPAIAHWNFNHFVVLESWSEQTGATVVDPASGRRRVGVQEFGQSFTGVVLSMEPGAGFERVPDSRRRSRVAHLAGLFRAPAVRSTIAQVLAASLVLQVLGLAFPLLTKVVVDGIVPFGVTGVMGTLGMGMVVVVAAGALVGYLRAGLLVYLQGRLDARLMLGFFDHLLSLPFRFFQERSTGDLLQRVSSNLVLREVLSGQTVSLLLDGTFALAYLALLFAISPLFGTVALVVGAAQVGLMLAMTGRVHELMHRELAAQAESSSYSVEVLKGIALLKATGAEARALDRWSDLFFRQLNVSLRRGHLMALFETALSTLRTASPLLVLWIGALLVLRGEMTLGTMLALNAVTVSFLAPVASLVSSGQRLQLVGAHLDRILDVMATPPEQAEGTAVAPGRISGRIELRDVSFRYAPDAPWVLRHVSLVVEPGEKVALVGRTGSGKSTLAALMMALYEPTEGEVLYDGIPATRLHLASLRAQFGVVLQEPFLFSGSIRRNVAFQDPEMPMPRVARAALLAGLHEEVAQMPMGYETVLPEGGSGLSGGQRQRLAIARAVASEPAVLLLDEATSHLDTLTEERVDRNLSQLECTRVVIAHRMSTVRNADQVLVLDRGQVVERGTHEELLERGGLYAALAETEHDGAATADALSAGMPA